MKRIFCSKRTEMQAIHNIMAVLHQVGVNIWQLLRDPAWGTICGIAAVILALMTYNASTHPKEYAHSDKDERTNKKSPYYTNWFRNHYKIRKVLQKLNLPQFSQVILA